MKRFSSGPEGVKDDKTASRDETVGLEAKAPEAPKARMEPRRPGAMA